MARNKKFKHKSFPLRIDQFLKIHINSIIGSMNIIGNTLGASKPEIKYNNYNLIGKKDEVVVNEQSDNSGNNMNTYDWFVHNIKNNDDNVNELNLKIENNNDNVNEFNLKIEKNNDNVNEFNLETEKNEDIASKFSLEIEKNDDNVN